MQALPHGMPAPQIGCIASIDALAAQKAVARARTTEILRALGGMCEGKDGGLMMTGTKITLAIKRTLDRACFATLVANALNTRPVNPASPAMPHETLE